MALVKTYGLDGIRWVEDETLKAEVVPEYFRDPRTITVPSPIPSPVLVTTPTLTRAELDRISEIKNSPAVVPVPTLQVIDAAPIKFPADFSINDKVAVLEQVAESFTPKQVEQIVRDIVPEQKDMNAFQSTVKIFSDVVEAKKAGTITEDEGYEILESIGLHKGLSPDQKIGTALASGVLAIGGVAAGKPLSLTKESAGTGTPMSVAPTSSTLRQQLQSGGESGSDWRIWGGLAMIAAVMVLLQGGFKKLFK